MSTIAVLNRGLPLHAHVADVWITDDVIFACGGYNHQTFILASTDGTTFTRLNQPGTSGLRAMWVDESKGAEAFRITVVGEFGSVFHSLDHGRTWTRAKTGVEPCIHAIGRDRSGVYWAGGDEGVVLRSTDDALTWKPVKIPIIERAARIRRFGDRTFIVGNESLHEVDGAKVVRTFAKGLVGKLSDLLRTRAGTLLVVGTNGLLARSTDDGATWTTIALFVVSSATNMQTVDADLKKLTEIENGIGGDGEGAGAGAGTSTIVVVGHQGTLLLSRDDGQSFEPAAVDPPVDLWTVNAFPGGAFIGGSSGVVIRLLLREDAAWKPSRPGVTLDMGTPERPRKLPTEAWWSGKDQKWVIGPVQEPREGVYRMHRPDGSLQTEQRYVGGVLHGPFKNFHDNGDVAVEGSYHHGLRHGAFATYRAKGATTEPSIPTECVSSIVVGRRIYDRGVVEPISWFDKKGAERLPEGDLVPKRPKGVDARAFYWKEGACWAYGRFDEQRNARTGLWTWWNDKGLKTAEEDYRRDGTLYRKTRFRLSGAVDAGDNGGGEESEKRQNETTFHTTGKIQDHKYWFEHGGLMSHEQEDEKGRNILRAKFEYDGEIEAVTRSLYDPTGLVRRIIHAKNAEPVLRVERHGEDGKFHSEVFHPNGALGGKGPASLTKPKDEGDGAAGAADDDTKKLLATGIWSFWDDKGKPRPERDLSTSKMKLGQYATADRLYAYGTLDAMRASLLPAPPELAGIDDIDWAKLDAAFTSRLDGFPVYLRGLLDPNLRDFAFGEIYSIVEHQGTVYESTAKVTPFLVQILEHPSADPEQILDALIVFTNGSSYLAVHQHMCLMASQRAEPDFEERLEDELDQVAEVHRGIAGGVNVFIRLLDHESPDVRRRAAKLLAIAAGDVARTSALAALQVQLDRERDRSVRADIIIGLGLLAMTAEDLDRAAVLLGGPDALLEIAAALTIVRSRVRESPNVEVAVEILVGHLRQPSPEVSDEYDELAWADDDLTTDAGIAIAQFRPDVRDHVVPPLIEAMHASSTLTAITLVSALLMLTQSTDDEEDDGEGEDEDEDEDEDEGREEMTPLRADVVRAIAEREDIWTWVNLKEVLDNFGLPTERTELQELIPKKRPVKKKTAASKTKKKAAAKKKPASKKNKPVPKKKALPKKKAAPKKKSKKK